MGGSMGRHAEPALWVLVALRRGPHLTDLLDDVRRLDGAVGHGALLGTVARLEEHALVEPIVDHRAVGLPTGRTHSGGRAVSRLIRLYPPSWQDR
jgi:hypothetical protein